MIKMRINKRWLMRMTSWPDSCSCCQNFCWVNPRSFNLQPFVSHNVQISELIQGKRQCPDIVSIYSAAQYTVYTVHQWKYSNTEKNTNRLELRQSSRSNFSLDRLALADKTRRKPYCKKLLDNFGGRHKIFPHNFKMVFAQEAHINQSTQCTMAKLKNEPKSM